MLKYGTKEAEKKIQAVLDGISQGLDTKAACGIARVPYSTWRYWIKLAEEGKESYGNLALRAGEADAARKQIYFATLREAAKEDWKAAAWLLEKLYPNEYGNRSTVAHEGEGGITIVWDNELEGI